MTIIFYLNVLKRMSNVLSFCRLLNENMYNYLFCLFKIESIFIMYYTCIIHYLLSEAKHIN